MVHWFVVGSLLTRQFSGIMEMSQGAATLRPRAIWACRLNILQPFLDSVEPTRYRSCLPYPHVGIHDWTAASEG